MAYADTRNSATMTTHGQAQAQSQGGAGIEADERFRRSLEVSPLDMAMDIVVRTRVDKAAFKTLLSDVLGGKVLVKMRNDSRTKNGEAPLDVLKRYLNFAPEQQAAWNNWWKTYGQYAVQLVQQFALNSYTPNPAGVEAPPLASSVVVVTTAKHCEGVLSVSTVPMGARNALYDEVQMVMRENAHTFGKGGHPFRGDRAVRDTGRVEYMELKPCVESFLADMKKWKQIRGQTPTGAVENVALWQKARMLECFQPDMVPVNYQPGFDRNDLFNTNHVSLERFGSGHHRVALVTLDRLDTPMYMTWCLENELASFLSSVCAGELVCNSMVTSRLKDSPPTSISVVYPPDAFIGDESLLLVELLEKEIDIDQTLRTACNRPIPHSTHIHLYESCTISTHNAMVHQMQSKAGVELALSAAERATRKYVQLAGTLPRMVAAVLRCPLLRAQRCINDFVANSKNSEDEFIAMYNLASKKISEFSDIKTSWYRTVEKEWVLAQCEGSTTEGTQLQQAFDDLDGEMGVPQFSKNSTVKLGEFYMEFCSTQNLIKKWSMITDMKWCFALRELRMWALCHTAQELVPPPLPISLTEAQILHAWKIVSRVVHPDKTIDQGQHINEKFHQLSSAKEYAKEMIVAAVQQNRAKNRTSQVVGSKRMSAMVSS